MATKTSIIAAINTKIIANGNIRATDTNKILKDILDCDELNANSSLEIFDFQGNSASANGTANISYSIRGIHNLFANITLTIQVKESNTNTFSIPHGGKDIVTALSGILKDKNIALDFVVRITNPETAAVYKKLKIDPPKMFRIGSLNFGFNSTALLIFLESQEPNDKLVAGDSISTSFTLHSA